jgi:hypothetical protein
MTAGLEDAGRVDLDAAVVDRASRQLGWTPPTRGAG